MNFCKATTFDPTEPLYEPHYAEPLLSGLRCAFVFDGTKGQLETKGQVVPTVLHTSAQRAIKELEYPLIIEDVVIDGVLDMKTFHAFDVLPVESWLAESTTVPLHYRKSVLASIMMVGEFKRTVFVPAKQVYNIEDVYAAYHHERTWGGDGIVLKVIDSEYTFGPTEDWKVLCK